MDNKELQEAQNARAQIKAVYEDGFAEINGRRYDFQKTNHSRRVQVFAYFTSIQHLINNANFAFLDTTEFKKLWSSLEESFITFDGAQLSKMPQHWDEFEEDYITLVTTVFGVMSYPFMKGKNTD